MIYLKKLTSDEPNSCLGPADPGLGKASGTVVAVDGDVGGIDNSYDVGAAYGSCGYDIRHNLIINYTYMLPIFRANTGFAGEALGGWPDLFVANDGTEADLYRNNRNGTFTDVGLRSSMALPQIGTPWRGGVWRSVTTTMTGNLDLFITDFEPLLDHLWRNDGKGILKRSASPRKLRVPRGWFSASAEASSLRQ